MLSGLSQPHVEDSPIIPEMQTHFISWEVGVVLLSERFPDGRDLLA